MDGKKEERTNSEEWRFIIPGISSAVDSDTDPEENEQPGSSSDYVELEKVRDEAGNISSVKAPKKNYMKKRSLKRLRSRSSSPSSSSSDTSESEFDSEPDSQRTSKNKLTLPDDTARHANKLFEKNISKDDILDKLLSESSLLCNVYIVKQVHDFIVDIRQD